MIILFECFIKNKIEIQSKSSSACLSSKLVHLAYIASCYLSFGELCLFCHICTYTNATCRGGCVRTTKNIARKKFL